MNVDKYDIFLKEITKTWSAVVLDGSSYVFCEFGKYFDEMFMNVFYCDNFNSVIEVLKNNHIDILFFDFELKNENPFKAINKLQENRQLPIIIAVSDFFNEEMLFEIIRSPIKDILKKPFRTIDIKNLLIRLVNSQVEFENSLFSKKSNLATEKSTPMETVQYMIENFLVDIELVNHYKGVPIFRAAKLVDLNNNELFVKTELVQQKIAEYLGHAIITSKYLAKDIYANIKKIDYKKQIIIFGDMDFIKSYVHHRKSVRMVPDSSFSLIIECENINYNFSVVNISMNYALLGPVDLPSALNINSKLKVHISFRQNSQNSENSFKQFNIKTNGNIRDIFKVDAGARILVFFELDAIDKHHFENYLYFRSVELISEFKNILRKQSAK